MINIILPFLIVLVSIIFLRSSLATLFLLNVKCSSINLMLHSHLSFNFSGVRFWRGSDPGCSKKLISNVAGWLKGLDTDRGMCCSSYRGVFTSVITYNKHYTIVQRSCGITSGSAPVTDPLSANAKVDPQAMPPNFPTRNNVASKSEIALPQKWTSIVLLLLPAIWMRYMATHHRKLITHFNIWCAGCKEDTRMWSYYNCWVG